MEREYQVCNQCVMDTTDPDITFDENGFCNHCTKAIKNLNEHIFIDEVIKKQRLNEIIDEIKKNRKGEKYDCVIGLSGGVDSSYLAYLVVKEFNLRLLAIHIDNGWNSELAVNNIENIIKILNIDLYTHVIDWEEFKSLQIAFLKASVVDLEMLSDHAISVVIYKIAKENKIPYFLSGSNIVTESMMPMSWFYQYKLDSLNIRDIYKKYGENKKIKSFSFLNFYQYMNRSKLVKQFALLNFIDYKKENAKKKIIEKLNWQDYGGKHLESNITKFYQNYILPQKFGIDKRKPHLSILICAGQITRNEALKELNKPLYDPIELEKDIQYFIKKLELTENEFDKMMKAPRREHYDFRAFSKTQKKIISKVKKIKRLYNGIFKKN